MASPAIAISARACFVLLMLCAGAIHAGATPTTCLLSRVKVKKVHGTVRDLDRIPIPIAKVILRKDSQDGVIVAETVSGSNGEFYLPKVPYGRYYLSVAVSGFSVAVIDVRVSRFASSKTQILVRMELAGDCSGAETGKIPTE